MVSEFSLSGKVYKEQTKKHEEKKKLKYYFISDFWNLFYLKITFSANIAV